jgi:hypothetical protein
VGVTTSVNTRKTGNQISECVLTTFIIFYRDPPTLSEHLIAKILAIKLILYSKDTPVAITENDKVLPNC